MMNFKITWKLFSVCWMCFFLTGCTWDDFFFFIFPPVAEKIAATHSGENVHVAHSLTLKEGHYHFLFLMPTHDCKKKVDADIYIKIRSGNKVIFSKSDNFKNMLFTRVRRNDDTREDDDEVLEAALAQLRQGATDIYIRGQSIRFSKGRRNTPESEARLREKLKETIKYENSMECVGLGFFDTKGNDMSFDMEKSYDNAVIEVHCAQCEKITETSMEIWIQQSGLFTSTRKVNNRLCKMRKDLNPDLYCYLPMGM